MSASRAHDQLERRVLHALGDLCGVEIMLNPDGRPFVERLGQGAKPIVEIEGYRGDHHRLQQHGPCATMKVLNG